MSERAFEAATPAPPFSAWERSIAMRYLRAKRKEGGAALVTVISFIGVMLAVTALIVVMSIMNGFRAELMSKILGFNGHVYVAGQPINAAGRDETLSRIRALPEVVQAAPLVEAQAMVVGRGQITGAIVRGVTPEDLRQTPIIAGNIKRGALAGFGAGEYGGDLILIGDRLAAQLDVEPGDPVTLISPTGGATPFGSTPRSKDYTVGGVFSVGMSEYDQAFVYMPLEQAQLFFGREGAVDIVEIKLRSPDEAQRYRDVVAREVGPGAIVTDWTDRNKSYFNALQVERTAMRFILLFVVALAALNIITGLVMLVKNKGRDIAILRTMGAARGAILRVFLMAGSAIGVAGTFAGLVLGVLFCTFIKEIQAFIEWVTGADIFSADVYFLSHLPAKLDWQEVIIVVVWAVVMSFLATLMPAWWASRFDPVEALRNE